MKCQICGDKEATVHLTDLLNEEELHLCDKCAEDQGAVMPTLSVGSVLSNLIDQQDEEEQVDDEAVCPLCEMKYSEVRKQGKVGCGRCYEAFAVSLVPFVERIQGSDAHKGKTPAHMANPAEARIVKKLSELRKRLRMAIREEDYELAAHIRDEIKGLEKGEFEDATE